MRETPPDESLARDRAARETPNKQPNMSLWAKRFLLPFLPLWIVVAIVVLAFLAVILNFAL